MKIYNLIDFTGPAGVLGMARLGLLAFHTAMFLATFLLLLVYSYSRGFSASSFELLLLGTSALFGGIAFLLVRTEFKLLSMTIAAAVVIVILLIGQLSA